MIVHFSVCDHCSAQKQIGEPEIGQYNTEDFAVNGFEFSYYVCDLSSSMKNGTFGRKFLSGTFCDKECLLEYLKENMKKDGTFKK